MFNFGCPDLIEVCASELSMLSVRWREYLLPKTAVLDDSQSGARQLRTSGSTPSDYYAARGAYAVACDGGCSTIDEAVSCDAVEKHQRICCSEMEPCGPGGSANRQTVDCRVLVGHSRKAVRGWARLMKISADQLWWPATSLNFETSCRVRY